jgi:hypothetical protein
MKVKCEFCGDKMSKRKLYFHECPKAPIECNICRERINREDWEDHSKFCMKSFAMKAWDVIDKLEARIDLLEAQNADLRVLLK